MPEFQGALAAKVSVEDGLDLAALLQRHPEYEQKVGCGVDQFTVMMAEHGTQCFRVIEGRHPTLLSTLH